MRTSKRWMRWVCAMTVAAPAAVSATAQVEFRVYDVSDLLPEEVRVVEDVKTAQRMAPSTLASRLAGTLGVDAVVLGPGLVGVVAEAAGHEEFDSAIGALHAAYRERVSVRIAMYEADRAGAIAIGGAVDALWGEPVRQVQQAIHRRVPSNLESTTVRRFISDVNIVTGMGGLGFEPSMEEVTEGLRLRVRVGAMTNDGRSLVDARGQITRVELREERMRGALNPTSVSEGHSEGPFELPTIDRRPIQTTLHVGRGRETVIAVMDQPDGAKRLIVTVTLAEAP